MNLQYQRQQFIYSLEKYKRISRWNKVSTIKKEKKKRKRFIRNDQSREKTYNGEHNIKGDKNTENEVLLIKSSKLSIPRSFSTSTI